MPEKKRFLIIDGNALVHRAFHALPVLTTKKGKPTNAVYGFLLVFFKALRELKPDFVAATFDLPAPTFRHKRFKDYKGKRQKAPDELYEQIPTVKKVLGVFGVPVFEKEGFEADDLIGTLSKISPEKFTSHRNKISGAGQVYPPVENIILSGDLDTLQLVDKNTKVYTLKKGLKDTILYDEETVKERYGLEPEQLVDFKALRGDPSDNIPGVPGIGEKTAAKLIKEFKTLENLYSALDQREEGSALNPRLRAKLQENKDQAFFSKMLVNIKRDVPIDFKIEDCAFQDYDAQSVRKILNELEFHTLINRLPAAKKDRDKEQEASTQGKKEWSLEKPSGLRKNLKIW